MKSTFIAGLLLLLIVPLAFAQGSIPERLLLSTGQYVGTGARPLGMGGTYTGIADDYTAAWWNPAGLAQVKRIELQGSLSRTGYSNSTNYFGGTRTGSTSGIRLNNAGLVFPVPVYQGALSFAFGYNQLTSFDRRTRIVSQTAGSYWDNFDELEGGRLGMWSFDGAMDVSPNLALGLGLNYFSGSDDYSLTGSYTVSGTPYYSQQQINTSLSGWGANFGALLRLGRYGRAGLMIQTPVIFNLSEDHAIDSSSGSFDYKMYYPAVFRLGGSFAPGRWLLAADVEYRDWTSLEFRSDTPFEGVTQAEANQQIKDTYQGTTRLSVGGEYLFPAYGLRARAGYAFEPSAYQKAGSKADRNLFSLGLGILVDKSVMFDAAVQFTNYTENITPGLTEKIKANNALLTVSYRM
ncbi:MAG TPA: outer membrane protein transport protein [bacterium]|jgi:long-subunit fatty acid transport protein